MPVRQSSLSTEQQDEIIARIAGMLSIEKARYLLMTRSVVQKTTDCVQTQDKLYYNTPNTTFLHLYVFPDPTSENSLNSPLSLVQNLNLRRDEIQVFVPRLAQGDLLGIQELQDNIPSFQTRPYYVASTIESLTFTVFY